MKKRKWKKRSCYHLLSCPGENHWISEVKKYLHKELDVVQESSLELFRKCKGCIADLIKLRIDLKYTNNESVFRKFVKLESWIIYKDGVRDKKIAELLWGRHFFGKSYKDVVKRHKENDRMVIENIIKENTSN